MTKVHKGILVHQVPVAQTEYEAHQDLQALLVHKEKRDNKVERVIRVTWDQQVINLSISYFNKFKGIILIAFARRTSYSRSYHNFYSM